MLNGSVFLRIAVLLIAAAALTGLVRSYFGHDGGLPDVPPAAAPPQPAPAPPAERRRAEPAPPPARDAEPAPTPAPAPPPGPTANTTATPPPAPTAPAPPPLANDSPVALQPPPEDEPPSPQTAETANPAGMDPVDLNTASVAQLNGLKGGGAIGRAIVQHRPYTSVDQLLSKRVLSRAVFQRIKAQVIVR